MIRNPFGSLLLPGGLFVSVFLSGHKESITERRSVMLLFG